MFEDIVNSILTRFLGEYIKNIEKKDLKVSMWKGDVKLKNLEIKPDALDFLELPVEIKSGYIGELSMRLPWKDVGRKPTRVNINQIYVVVCPRSEIQYDTETFKQREIELKRQRLRAISERDLQREKQMKQKEDKSVLGGIVSKVVRNFELTINEIHIRYEDHSSDSKHPFCGGIILESIVISPNKQREGNVPSSPIPEEVMRSPTPEGAPAPSASHNGVFSKEIMIQNFGVYWDSDNKNRINVDSIYGLTQSMHLAFESDDDPLKPIPQSFIINPFSMKIAATMDIRGVELRKPTPEEAALRAVDELGWDREVMVNQKFIKVYQKIRRDDIRGRTQDEEVILFVEKFKSKYPKFCSSTNLHYATVFAKLCWKHANTASPVVIASATLDRFAVTIEQNQIRDVKILLANLSLQSKRAQFGANRPTKSVLEKPRRWWKYAIRCVLEKNKQKRQSRSWIDFQSFKRERTEYIGLYKKMMRSSILSVKKEHTERLQELEDILSVENVIMFRKMAVTEIENEKKKRSEDDNETMETELYKELEISSEDISPWIGGQPKDIIMSVDFVLKSMSVVLRKEAKDLTRINIEMIGIRAFKRQDYLELWLAVKDMSILDTITEKSRFAKILSINHRVEESAAIAHSPIDVEENDGEIRMENGEMTRNEPLIPYDMREMIPHPFVAMHIQLPSLDNKSDIQIDGTIETIEFVVNIPWVLEIAKFMIPENIVIMSHYEESAYNMVREMRSCDSNMMEALQATKGFCINMKINPMNVIIPSLFNGKRGKCSVLLFQIGSIDVVSEPRVSNTEMNNMYNDIHIQLHEIGIGIVEGREYDMNQGIDKIICQRFTNCYIINPFDISMTFSMCIMNSLRYAGTKLSIAIHPITIRITPVVIELLLKWGITILSRMQEKQKELDIDIMNILLQPKQLLFSCIAYTGSTHLYDHTLEQCYKNNSKLQRVLFDVIHATNERERKRLGLDTDRDNPSGLSSLRSMRSMHSLSAGEDEIEKRDGVVQLTYEDLLLIQYKPMMAIDIDLKEIHVQCLNGEDELLGLNCYGLNMKYNDHFYDLSMDIQMDRLDIVDYVMQKHLIAIGKNNDGMIPYILRADSPISVYFYSVGDYSCLADYYTATTNISVSMTPIQMYLNCGAFIEVMKILPDMSSLPSLPKAESSSSPPTSPLDTGYKRDTLSFSFMMPSFSVGLMTDSYYTILELSLLSLSLDLTQSVLSTHILASLQDVSIVDKTEGAGLYSSVLSIKRGDKKDIPFIKGDIELIDNRSNNDYNSRIDVFIQAPLLVIRYRFIQELLSYTKHGSCSTLLASFSSPPPSLSSPSSPLIEDVSSSNLHSYIRSFVDSICTMLIRSGVIHEEEHNGNKKYSLPLISFNLSNLIVCIPASSSSDEMLSFEMGELALGNQSNYEGLEYSRGFDEDEAKEVTMIYMIWKGMHLMSIYDDEEKRKEQYVLNDVTVVMRMSLSSVFYCKLAVSPIMISINEHQMGFLRDHMTYNLQEDACTEYVNEEQFVLSLPPKQVKNETVVNTKEKPDCSQDFWIGNAFYVDIVFEDILFEVFKGNGGYDVYHAFCLGQGHHEDSITLLRMKNLVLNQLLNQKKYSLSLTLASLSLQDTRSEASIPQFFMTPLLVGSASHAAITVTVIVHNDTVCVDCRLFDIQIVPAPLFIVFMGLIPAYETVLEAEDKGVSEIEPVEAMAFEVSPMIKKLLSVTTLSVHISPIGMYIPSSFTSDSSLLLVSLSLDMIISVSSQVDIACRMSISDLRSVVCSLTNLRPPRDCNDVIQSWNLPIVLYIKDSMKTIEVRIETKQELRLYVGYLDIEIALKCITEMTKQMGTSKQVEPIESAESAESLNKGTIPMIKLPYLLPLLDSVSLSVSLLLSSVHVIVMNDVTAVKLPLLQLYINELSVSIDKQKELLMVLHLSSRMDSYNPDLIVWEPVLEPWGLMVQLIQRNTQEGKGNHLELKRAEEVPIQSEMSIRSDNKMNIDMSYSFCKSIIEYLHNYNMYIGNRESSKDEDGYYIYFENDLNYPIEIEIIYDGGFSTQEEKMKEAWKNREMIENKIIYEGVLYGKNMEDSSVSLFWVCVCNTSPNVIVYENTIDKDTQEREYVDEVDKDLKLDSKGLFTATMKSGRRYAFFGCSEYDNANWKEKIEMMIRIERDEHDGRVSVNDSIMTILPRSEVKSHLPAHPCLSVTEIIESYNQRLLSVRIDGNKRFEFCCDYEGDLPFSVYSNANEHLYDINVRVTNKKGRRIICFSSLLSIMNLTGSAVFCRFIKEEEHVKDPNPTIRQSQRSQINLSDLHDNYFGNPINSKSKYYDSGSLGCPIEHACSNLQSPIVLEKGQSHYVNVDQQLKGYLELLGDDAKTLSNCVHNRMLLEDITSLNLRRLCFNVGSLYRPHYVLLRVITSSVHSNHLKSLSCEEDLQCSLTTHPNSIEVLKKCYKGVYGNVLKNRSVFTIQLLPVLILRNLLPLDLEYRIMKHEEREYRIVENGTIRSGNRVEIRSMNGNNSNLYGIVIRPCSQQYVWGQQMIRITMNAKGTFMLNDMDNTHTSIQYQYYYDHTDVGTQCDIMHCSFYSAFWVINRTLDTLFISGKSENDPTVKLPPSSCCVTTSPLSKKESIIPVLFNVPTKGKKVSIRIRRGNSSWSKSASIQLNVVNRVHTPASLPYTPCEYYYSVKMKSADEPYHLTKLLIIQPYYAFINKTGVSLSLHQYLLQNTMVVEPYSVSSYYQFAPSPSRLISLSATSRGDANSVSESSSLPNPSNEGSSLFDCDGDHHYELFFNTGEVKNQLMINTMMVNDTQAIIVDQLKEENIGYCVSNDTCLDIVTVVQVSNDLSKALSIQPLSSHMLILPDPLRHQQVAVFIQSITEKEKTDGFSPKVIVDMNKEGVVKQIMRENPKRTTRVEVIVDNSTKILVISDVFDEMEEERIRKKKDYTYMNIVLEDSIIQWYSMYEEKKNSIDEYSSAMKDFVDYAEGKGVKENAQPVIMNDVNNEIDLMLDDDYFYLYISVVSIRNLKRKLCSTCLRISDGDTIVNTNSCEGSHVFVNKEILVKQKSDSLKMKAIISFEEGRIEYDTEIDYKQYEAYDSMQSLRIPFGLFYHAINSNSINVNNRNMNKYCDGGYIYGSIIHCHNNVINNNDKFYLPRLYRDRIEYRDAIINVFNAKVRLHYESKMIGIKYKDATGDTSQNVDSSSINSLKSYHIQRALHQGYYSGFEEKSIQVDIAAIEERIENGNDEIIHSAMEADEEDDGIEEKKRYGITIKRLANIVQHSETSIYSGYIEYGESRIELGECKSVTSVQAYDSKIIEVVYKNTDCGCSYSYDKEGKVIVTRVERNSDASNAGVIIGMVLVGINKKMIMNDGFDINNRIQHIATPYTCSYLPPLRISSLRYVDLFYDKHILLPQGETRHIDSVTIAIQELNNGVSLSAYLQTIPIIRYDSDNYCISDPNQLISSCELQTTWEDGNEGRIVDTAISVSIGGVIISIFNGLPQEVMSCFIDPITIGLNAYDNNEQQIELSIVNVQVDNCLLNALQPVLIGKEHKNNDVFLSLKLLYRSHPLLYFIQFCEFSIQSFFIALDNHLLIALLQMISQLPLHLLSSSYSSSFLESTAFSPIVYISSSSSSLRLFIQKLFVSNMVLIVSNRVDPSIPLANVFLPSYSFFLPIEMILDTLCSLVGDIDDTPLRLSPFSLSKQLLSEKDLITVLKRVYLPQITSQAAKIIGSMNIIGNPVGLVDDISSGLKAFITDPINGTNSDDKAIEDRINEGGEVLARNATKGILNTTSKITNTLGNAIASLTLNKHYKEQRGVGRKGLVHGVTSGFTGLVMDPVRGAKKDGFKGAMTGIGTGLFGVVFKPISGLLDETTKVLEAAKDAMGVNDRATRMRYPRCVLCDRIIRSYDEHNALGQMIYETAVTRYLVNKKDGEQFVLYCCVDSNKHYFVLTQYHSYLLNSGCDLLWWKDTDEMTIDIEEEEMRITCGKESILIVFGDKDICSRIYGILLNVRNWSNKEIVQCSYDFYHYVNEKCKRYLFV